MAIRARCGTPGEASGCVSTSSCPATQELAPVDASRRETCPLAQVVEILTKLHASGDIAGAVSSAVPTRKQHAAPSGSEDGEEEKRTGEGGGEGEGEEEKRRGKEGGEE